MTLLRNLMGIAVVTGLLVGCGGPMPEEGTPSSTAPESSPGEVTAQAPPCSFCEFRCEQYGWESYQCRNCWDVCIEYIAAPQ